MNRIKKFLFNYLHIQLMVTLVAMPFLITWGLGLSIMTFVGNLVFAPLLTLIITLSSLLFFTQLFDIPNNLLAHFFSSIIQVWDTILAWGTKDWLIAFANPGCIALTSIPIITYVLLKHPFINTPLKRIITMVILLFFSCLGLWLYQHYKATSLLEIKTKNFVARLVDQEIEFIDYGFFNAKTALDKAIEFEIKPTLTKIFGKKTIKKLILAKPGQRSFDGAQQMCHSFNVKMVVIPYFDKKLSRRGWRAFFSLKRFTHEQGIIFHRSPSSSLQTP